VAGLASQQVNPPILTLYPNWQPIPDAVSCALGMLRTTQVVGNVTCHIEHFAFHQDFLSLRDGMSFGLRQFEAKDNYTRRDNDRCRNLQDLQPISTNWNRPMTDDPFPQISWRLRLKKLGSYGVVTTGLLSQPLRKLWIVLRVHQRLTELRIAIVD
jgi:hypothetical protein